MSEMTSLNDERRTPPQAETNAPVENPTLAVSLSVQDREQKLTEAIPQRKVVEGKIAYYVKGVSCRKFGLEHDYKPVAGKHWAKCPRCNSTRTIKAKAETPSETEA